MLIIDEKKINMAKEFSSVRFSSVLNQKLVFGYKYEKFFTILHGDENN